MWEKLHTTMAKVNATTLYKNAKKEWKQVNRSLMFTLNVMNNAIKGNSCAAPELRKYVREVLGVDKVEIMHLLQAKGRQVCVLQSLHGAQKDAILEFMSLGNTSKLQLTCKGSVGLSDYVVTPKGAVYRLKILNGYRFVDLIDSIQHNLKVMDMDAELSDVARLLAKETKGVSVGKETTANYLKRIKGTNQKIAPKAKKIAPKAKKSAPKAKLA